VYAGRNRRATVLRPYSYQVLVDLELVVGRTITFYFLLDVIRSEAKAP